MSGEATTRDKVIQALEANEWSIGENNDRLIQGVFEGFGGDPIILSVVFDGDQIESTSVYDPDTDDEVQFDAAELVEWTIARAMRELQAMGAD